MVPLQVLSYNVQIVNSRVVAAITYATNNSIPILNYSIINFGRNPIIRNAIINYPGLFVWCAGNYGENLDSTIPEDECYDLPNLISVGATDENDERWHNSSFGQGYRGRGVNIWAPGARIHSTTNNGGYSTGSGTSNAAAFVSGVAALLLSKDPSLTADDLKQIMLHTSNRITINTPAGLQDVHRLNAAWAVRYSLPPLKI